MKKKKNNKCKCVRQVRPICSLAQSEVAPRKRRKNKKAEKSDIFRPICDLIQSKAAPRKKQKKKIRRKKCGDLFRPIWNLAAHHREKKIEKEIKKKMR